MPEAEKFTALGAGNGFPWCPNRVDVDTADKWTTLSGYNSTSVVPPTDAQINESRRLAMAYFWNAYQINTSITENDIEYLTQTNTIDNVSEGGPEITPKSRMCRGNGGFTDSWIYREVSATEDALLVYGGFDVCSVYKNDQFLGYGINQNGFSMGGVFIESYLSFACNNSENGEDYFFNESDFCEISYGSDTLHAVCSGYGETITSVDLANRTMTAEFSVVEDMVYVYTLNSLSPYTY